MTPRILYLHAGGSKTGSSVIQYHLRRLSSKLLQEGLYYPLKTNDHFTEFISSGNGVTLFDLVRSGLDEDKLKQHMENMFSVSDTVLISSEFFESFTSSEIQFLNRCALALDIHVSWIYYIRNAYEYAIAQYDQSIKRGHYSDSLNEYLQTEIKWWHHFFLETITKEKVDLKVYCYKGISKNFLKQFLINIDSEKFKDFEFLEKGLVVNRSLSFLERNLLRSANKYLTAQLSQELSDELTSIGTEIPIKQVSIEDYRNLVIAINQLIKNGSSPLFPRDKEISDALFPTKVPESMSIVENTSDLFRCCSLVSRLVELTCDSQKEKLIDDLVRFGCELGLNKDSLPVDFNVHRYLQLNLDVLKTGVNPYLHYLKHGLSEGRRYK